MPNTFLAFSIVQIFKQLNITATFQVTLVQHMQPPDLAWSRSLFRSSCAIKTSSTDYSDDSWRYTLFSKHEHGALWFL